MDTKYCTTCKKTKSIEEFYKSRGAADGRQNRCKTCYRVIARCNKAKPKHEASHQSEQYVIDVLKSQGIYCAAGKSSEYKYCDLIAWGCVRIEVKTANQKDGAFMFTSTPRQQEHGFVADLVILVCKWEDETTLHIFPSNHPVFYRSGRIKSGFYYDPYIYKRKSGHGGRLTNALMKQHQNRWDLIECKRLEIASGEQSEHSIHETEYMFQPALINFTDGS